MQHFFKFWESDSCSKIFESECNIFSNFENPTPVQTPATIDATKFSTVFNYPEWPIRTCSKITAVLFAMHWWWKQELSKRLQYVVCIVFFGRDFHYKAIQHFRSSCTKVFTLTQWQWWRPRGLLWNFKWTKCDNFNEILNISPGR